LTAPDAPVPVVIVASERIDDSPDWRMLAPGELVHVTADLSFNSMIALDEAPARYVAPAEADPNVDTF
jgi:glutamine amidotransferase